MEDKEFILESARNLKRWEETPRRVADDYADMDRDELIRLIAFLRERLEEAEAARKKEHEESSERISALTSEVSGLNRRVGELTDMLKASYVSASETAVQMSELLRQLKDKDRKIAELQSTAKVARKNMFGSKSQKGTKAKGRDNGNGPTPHTDVKDGFDGTSASLPDNLDLDVDVKNDTAAANPPSATQKESRLNRIGMTYRTMNADNHVLHRSDKSKLPEGATFIRTFPRYAYNQETVVTEHEYETVVFRDKDGNILCGYFPMDSEEGAPIIESVPGTHAAPGLMAYLVFNRFFLDTPVYRETKRLLQEKMRVSRQTITNWLEKGAGFFKEVLAYLKDNCLEKDSVVNCDETWCRVKVGGKYMKRYVWCLVNKASKTAVYYYDIRPLSNERKNSLFFGSDRMARVSAAYHSVVSTCRLQGYSILEYLKKFFAEIVAGNRNYGKLMPSTIGITANKL